MFFSFGAFVGEATTKASAARRKPYGGMLGLGAGPGGGFIKRRVKITKGYL